MKTGILIFAIDNGQIEYTKLANWSAKNIHRHLQLPVCLVTNKTPEFDHVFDEIVCIETPTKKNDRFFEDFGQTLLWFNDSRTSAAELSPWDKTIVLDADYVVSSDQLLTLSNINEDFLCHKTSYDLTGGQAFDELNCFGEHRMPMWWATVMMFTRSTRADFVFSTMKMVQDNWEHYRNIYKFTSKSYRNDYAISIAMNMASGHTTNYPDIPWNLAATLPNHTIEMISDDKYKIKFVTSEGNPRYVIANGLDFHAMGKKNLGELIGG